MKRYKQVNIGRGLIKATIATKVAKAVSSSAYENNCLIIEYSPTQNRGGHYIQDEDFDNILLGFRYGKDNDNP